MDKPKCYGRYPTKDNPGAKCRGCSFAQDCKTAKPKAGRPPKTEPELEKEQVEE